MQYIDPSTAALLDEGRIIVRGMIKFLLGSGAYGFIKSAYPFTWNGLDYVPGGLIQVSDLSGGLGTTARNFEVRLAASPDDGLTPAKLQAIEAEDYRDRPVTIYDALFHPDSGALLTVRTMRRGYIDVIDHVEDADGYVLVASCETRALDYSRVNGRKRNTADQKRRSPTDGFYDHASKRGKEEIFWGRKKES